MSAGNAGGAGAGGCGIAGGSATSDAHPSANAKTSAAATAVRAFLIPNTLRISSKISRVFRGCAPNGGRTPGAKEAKPRVRGCGCGVHTRRADVAACARTFPRRLKTAAKAVDRACAGRFCFTNKTAQDAYRCGTALDFDQLPQLSPARGASAAHVDLFSWGE